MIAVHHVGLRGPAPLPPGPTRHLDVGTPLALTAGANLYVACARGEDDTPRPVNATGIAHLCLQAFDDAATRAALEGAGTRFLSPPTALGTGFRYAYGHLASGALIELESAPFLPSDPASWFGHVAFVSRDAERLARFYADLLDGEIEAGVRLNDNPRIDAVAGLNGVDLQAWWVRAAGFTLEFWRYHAPPAPNVDSTRWYTHLGLEVGDLDDALRRLGSDGAVVTGVDGRSACAADPDGNRVLLIEFAAPDHRIAALPHRDALARAAAARPA